MNNLAFKILQIYKCKKSVNRTAYTLAEVLIVIAVIGVVAAITLPSLITNMNEKVRNRQIAVFKQKLAQSTSKMNAMGQMIPYDTTDEFVNEFSKHYKIIQKCSSNELEKCWPAKVIKVPNAAGELQEKNVSDIETGNDLRAFALGTKDKNTVGIISADGVPMILVYSPRCQMDDGVKGMSSASCISAIYDINGGSGPNRLGVDVRTINSLYGAVDLGQNYDAVPSKWGNQHICIQVRRQLGVEHVPCPHDIDNKFLGAMKACHDLKLHLPTRETLATAAGTNCGLTDLGINENLNCYGQGCWNQPAEKSRTSPLDPTSVKFGGSYWSDTPFIFRHTSGSSSVTFSCNALCSNYWAQSALCVGD